MSRETREESVLKVKAMLARLKAEQELAAGETRFKSNFVDDVLFRLLLNGKGDKEAQIDAAEWILAMHVEYFQLLEAFAKDLYEFGCDNGPIHCNRNPPWDELNETVKAEWFKEVRKKLG